MSECRRSFDTLLDADVAELSGLAETELAVHISGCISCAAAARKILEGNDTLDDVLGSAPPIDARALVARARLEALPKAVEKAPNPARRWRGWAMLGAAASIAALLVLSERDVRMPGVEVAPRTEVHAIVEAPAGRNVAVIQTDDPDITVLWFF